MGPPEPAHAIALVRTEDRLEVVSGVRSPPRFRRVRGVWRPQAVEDSLHPRPGLDARPRARLFGESARRVVLERSARHEAQRLVERNAVALRGVLDALPVAEHFAEARAVGLDPPAPDEDEALGGLEDGAALGVRERLAVDREARGEVEHGVGRELRRRLPADPDDDLGPGGRAGRPPVRDAHGDARALEHGHLLQEGVSLARRPRQRVVDVAAVHERPHERALLCGALDGQQQREEPLAIARRPALLDRVTQGPVLRSALRREARRVRREEGEGALGVALVLGEMEHDAPHRGPRVVLRVQPFEDRSLPARHLRGERFARLAPYGLEALDGHVLGAAHGRSARGQRGEPVGRRLDAHASP